MEFFIKNQRDENRHGTFLQMSKLLPNGGTREVPDIVIPHIPGSAQKRDTGLIRAVAENALGKRGLPSELVEQVIELAEVMYEERLRVQDARLELRRRMEGQIPTMRKVNDKWVKEKGHALFTNYRQV